MVDPHLRRVRGWQVLTPSTFGGRQPGVAISIARVIIRTVSIHRELEAGLQSLGHAPADGVWSLVVWADRAIKTYASRELASVGNVFLRAWDCATRSPTPCSMAIYRSEALRLPGTTDFLALFRSFATQEEPSFILGEDELRATMKAEAAALSELKNTRPVTTPLSLEIELF